MQLGVAGAFGAEAPGLSRRIIAIKIQPAMDVAPGFSEMMQNGDLFVLGR
jgi:hypothetical protein